MNTKQYNYYNCLKGPTYA